MPNSTTRYEQQRCTFEKSLLKLASLDGRFSNLVVSDDFQEVYLAKTSDLSSGSLSPDTPPVNVQFHASDTRGNSVVGEVNIANPDLLIGLRYDAYAVRILRKLRLLSQEPGYNAQSEIAMLRVPGIQLEGLLLRQADRTQEQKVLSLTPPTPALKSVTGLQLYVDTVRRMLPTP